MLFLVAPESPIAFTDATCGEINFFSGEYRIQSLENTTLRMAFVSLQQKRMYFSPPNFAHYYPYRTRTVEDGKEHIQRQKNTL